MQKKFVQINDGDKSDDVIAEVSIKKSRRTVAAYVSFFFFSDEFTYRFESDCDTRFVVHHLSPTDLSFEKFFTHTCTGVGEADRRK